MTEANQLLTTPTVTHGRASGCYLLRADCGCRWQQTQAVRRPPKQGAMEAKTNSATMFQGDGSSVRARQGEPTKKPGHLTWLLCSFFLIVSNRRACVSTDAYGCYLLCTVVSSSPLDFCCLTSLCSRPDGMAALPQQRQPRRDALFLRWVVLFFSCFVCSRSVSRHLPARWRMKGFC